MLVTYSRFVPWGGFTHTTTTHPRYPSGVWHRFTFDNGRGASVIRFHGSHGGDAGLYELAVLDSAGSLDYTTPITSDVIGWLTEGEVTSLLRQIADLPEP